MQDFYYICGHLGHTIRDCGDKQYDDDEIQCNYEPWSRDSPIKKGNLSLFGQSSVQ